MNTTSPNDGGPAFPQPIDDMGTLKSLTAGMSLRDWFAGQAPAYPFKLPQVSLGQVKLGDKDDPHVVIADSIARWNYAFADAMLAERESDDPARKRGGA